MKRISLLLILFLFTATAFAQDKNLSEDDLQNRQVAKADVAPEVTNIKSETEFVQTFDWLMETPINQAEEKRQIVSASMSEYIEDHAEYEIDSDVKLLKFADSSPELLTVFMGGYTEYMINNRQNDQLEANIAGVEKVIDYYEMNREHIDKDRRVEKLIRKERKDKLKKYVEKKTR